MLEQWPIQNKVSNNRRTRPELFCEGAVGGLNRNKNGKRRILLRRLPWEQRLMPTKSWRGRREQKTTDLIDPPVPTGPNTHYIPPFELTWPIKWGMIENGEREFDEVLAPPAAARAGVPDGPEAPKFQSRRSIERRDQKTTEGDLPEVEAVSEVAVGERYLTATGVPVQVLGFRGELVLIQSLASENRYPLPLAYPLRPFDNREPAFPVKERPNRPIDSAQPTVAPEKRRLSPLIDAMLLAGEMTMKGIVKSKKN